MFTNNLKKEKKNIFEKENANFKKELQSLRRLKKQNNNSIFYNSEFIHSLEPRPQRHNFSLIKSIKSFLSLPLPIINNLALRLFTNFARDFNSVI